ncbi:MAG: glycosyltransferase family 39 protein [Salinibacterium sp.]|nr:glycosyltransferase family 39 protein [Salinibacterium sp.]
MRVLSAARVLVRGRTDAPAWERPAFIGLLAVAAALYLVNLSVSGWANSFYSAAVQAGSVNWEAFFYGSSDAANSITVDKPPASLWFMALSVRLLGLSPFAILLPEALMGVATVGVLYAIVRRRFPAGTALLAGLTLALTPVAALMFRFNNPDALLVLLLTLAVLFTLRGIESGRLRWVLWAGVMVGLGFLTKQLQAFLILPVLAGVYLYAAPRSLRVRFGHLFAALGAVIVSAGWWVAIVALVPASERPYVGGSQTNDFLELTFGYNGFGRLTGAETGSVTSASVGSHWGYTGIDRLFSGDIGGQITWLMFATLVALGVILWLMRKLPRTSAARATALLLGGTLVFTALAFSFMAGIFHAYYTVAMAPALAGSFAIGAGMLWARRSTRWVRILMAVLIAGTVAWGFELLYRSAWWLPWLRWIVVLLGVAAVVLVIVRGGRARGVGVASVALAAVLLGPLAFTLATLTVSHTGSVVTAGPSASVPRLSASNPASALQIRGATGGTLLSAAEVSPGLAKQLSAGATDYTWVAASLGSNQAAGYQLATGYPVMPVGGFNGSDPSPTLSQFQQYVAQRQIHWYIAGRIGKPNGGSNDSSRIASWVAANFEEVTLQGVHFYDLTRPLS